MSQQQNTTSSDSTVKRRRNKDGYYIEPYTVSVEDIKPSSYNKSNNNSNNNKVKNKPSFVSPLAENVILVHKNGSQVYVRHIPFEDYTKVTKVGRSFYEVQNDREERKLLCLSLTNPTEDYRTAVATEQEALLRQCQQHQQQVKGEKDTRSAPEHNNSMQINKELLHQLQLMDAPAVLDTYQPPAPRAADLRAFKHKNKMNYMKYKMMYSDDNLKMIEMEDRRALLTHEKRQVFLRQVQQDYAFRAKLLSSSLASQQQEFNRFVHPHNTIQNATQNAHLVPDSFIFTQARQVQEQHMQMFFLIRDQQQCVLRRQLREEAAKRTTVNRPCRNNDKTHFFTLDRELLDCVSGPSRTVDGYVLLLTERTFPDRHNNSGSQAPLFFESENDTEEEKVLKRGGVVIPIVYSTSSYLANPKNQTYKSKAYFSVDNYKREVEAQTKNNSSLFEFNRSSRTISNISHNSSNVEPTQNINTNVNKKTVVMKQRNPTQIVSRNETPLKKPSIAF